MDDKKTRFRALVRRVAEMGESDRVALADRIGVVTCEQHALSVRNCCLAWMQCESASIVGGYRQWLRQDRQVCKGQAAMMIQAPCIKKGQDGDPDSIYFRWVNVFDISQTQPVEVESECAA